MPFSVFWVILSRRLINMHNGSPAHRLESLKNGTLSREELSVSVKRILEMILWME